MPRTVQNANYEAAYNDGYRNGYNDGYAEALKAAKSNKSGNKTKKKKSGIGFAVFLLILGISFLITAGVYYGYEYYVSYKAGEESRAALDKLLMRSSDGSQNVTIDGVTYMGIIEIPDIEVTLPVIYDWKNDYDLLDMGPCRYTGDIASSSLIIMGHSYKTQFGYLSDLEVGDEIKLTTCDAKTYFYTVNEIGEISGNDVNGLIYDGSWDMSLFTCNYSGHGRITIRCTLNK